MSAEGEKSDRSDSPNRDASIPHPSTGVRRSSIDIQSTDTNVSDRLEHGTIRQSKAQSPHEPERLPAGHMKDNEDCSSTISPRHQ